MAILILGKALPKVYRMTLSHGIGQASMEEMRDNFRLIQAVAFAHIYDEDPMCVPARHDVLVDILLSEQFARKGYVTLSDESIVMCSYAGFERLTSKWAKQTYPDCRGVITTRLCKFDKSMNELAHYTVSVFF